MDSDQSHPPADRLASLCNRLQGLLQTALTPEQSESLIRALGEAQALSKPLSSAQTWSVDAETYAALMDIAGPLANDLLAQLHTDLNVTNQLLKTSMAAFNWDGIRTATHTLVSLAGSIGAEQLHALSNALNAAAHMKDTVSVAEIGPEVTAGLEHLIDFVLAKIDAAETGAKLAGQA